MSRNEYYAYLRENRKGRYVELYGNIENIISNDHRIRPIDFGRASYFIDWFDEKFDKCAIQFRHNITCLTIYIKAIHMELAGNILVNNNFHIMPVNYGWARFSINGNNEKDYDQVVELLIAIIGRK